jgi:hypothetical protein
MEPLVSYALVSKTGRQLGDAEGVPLAVLHFVEQSVLLQFHFSVVALLGAYLVSYGLNSLCAGLTGVRD